MQAWSSSLQSPLADPYTRVLPWQRLIAIVTAILTWLISSTLVYVMLTRVGDSALFAWQGRYLIPMTPLIAVVFRGNGIHENLARCIPAVATVWCIVSCCYTGYVMLMRYYLE